MPPAPAPPLGWDLRVAVALGLAFVVTYVAVAFLRLGYPFELEWMEGATLGHVDRVLRGQPLYVEPSIDFTPFIYPPLYFIVTAWVAKVLGAGFVAPRLVSIAASLGCLVLIYRYVRRDAASPWPAVLAASLFAATYAQGGAWLDLGRVDSMFLCLLLGGAVALRRVASPWTGGLAGGALFALSALTKQSALFVAAPVALALLVTDWRRGVACTAALALLLGGGVWMLDRQSHDWFRYYAFDLPRDHPIIPQLVRGFWTQDLLGPLAIALVIGLAWFFAAAARPRVRALALDAALIGGLIVTGYVTRVRVGSFVNVVLPAYLGVSLLLGLGLAALEHRRRPGLEGARRAERYVAWLLIAQFALLAYAPWKQLPTARDRTAGLQIVESLKRVSGDVWVPRHPYLAVMAGKPWHAHELALQDVMRPADTPEARALLAGIRAAARERRFDVVVLDDETWIHHEFQPTYRLGAQMFGATETDLFWPRTGFVTRPDFVWMPKPDSSIGERRAS